MLLDEQPVVALFSGPPMHAYQVPAPVQFFAVERERKMAFGQSFMRINFRLPTATVPNHDGAAAVFALRDCALEFVVGDRVVLDLDRQSFFTRHQTGAARDRSSALIFSARA